MQIIITLPEWIEIKGIDNKQFADLLPAYDEMLNMIKNGTPLPKGHGRLLDEKEILDSEEHDGGYYDLVDMPDYIAGVPAVIEADKAESEEQA